MANSQKVVDVPDIGVVAFPGDMEDTHVANYIKIARAKKKFSPLQTEESEHARQLKPAQPLDTAIPKLPDWATRPLLSEQEMQETPEAQRKTEQSQAAFTAEHPKIASAIGKGDNPAVLGVLGGAKDFMHGMTSPANLALMVGAPESKLLSAFFSMQALKGSYRNAQEAQDAYLKGNNTEAIKYATEALLGAGIAGLAGHHAVKDVPVPEGVKDFVKSEEGSVGSQEKVQNPEAENKTVKMLTDGKAGGYRLDHLLKNHPDVTITSVGTESLNPATLKRIQGWTRENKLNEWENSQANVKDMPPVEVVRTPHGDYLYDGTHRTEFATRQGEKVPATVYTIKTKGDAVTPVAPKIADVKAKAAELKPTTAYKSVDQSQPFFLKSENLITEKMKGPMPAEDVHKMLLSNGVKPEEMKWTGLDDMLKGKGKEKVTPADIQKHIAENDIQIQEVVKGQPKPTQWTENRGGIFTTPEGYKIERLDPNGKYVATSTSGIRQAFDTIDEAKNKVDVWRKSSSEDEVTPKFSSYQLPGGSNYRELLITMPPHLQGEAPVRPAKLPNGYQVGVDYSQPEHSRYHVIPPGQVHARPFNGRFPTQEAASEAAIDRIQSGALEKWYSSSPSFRSSHWDEPNVLGHVRFNDRTGPNGEHLLHIEELQSDWHQKGRAEGYKGEPQKTERWEAEARPHGGFTVFNAEGNPAGYFADAKTPEEAIKMASVTADHPNAVPDAPFKKNWHELMLKRMLKYAATNGYDGVSWTPGEEQASRYDLSKQIDHIDYRKTPDGKYSLAPVDKNGEGVDLPKESFTAEELPDVIGKEVAQKIVNGEGKPGGGRMTLSNLDLKIGGSGMKGFYDKIIPDAANKLGKQWGAKVGEVNLGGHKYSVKRSSDLSYKILDETGKDHSQGNFFETKEEAQYYADALQKESKPSNVPYIPITPQMRAGVKSIPYSLFSIPLAAGALSLAQVKAKAEELKKRSGVQ